MAEVRPDLTSLVQKVVLASREPPGSGQTERDVQLDILEDQAIQVENYEDFQDDLPDLDGAGRLSDLPSDEGDDIDAHSLFARLSMSDSSSKRMKDAAAGVVEASKGIITDGTRDEYNR